MIRRFLLWIGGMVMWLINRRGSGANRPDVVIDRDFEELKRRAEKKPYDGGKE